MKVDQLNPKQLLFCNQYLKDFNGTQAAIRAGYSKKSAAEQAVALLRNPKVHKYLQARFDKIEKKFEISREKVLSELERLAFSDARKLFDEQGNLLPIQSIDDSTASAIASLESAEEKTSTGKKSTLRKLKLADKIRALDSIRDMLGYSSPKRMQIDGNVNLADKPITFE